MSASLKIANYQSLMAKLDRTKTYVLGALWAIAMLTSWLSNEVNTMIS